MPKTCCSVPGCHERGGHEYPVDPERRAKWVQAVGRLDETTMKMWTPTKSSVVCQKHFSPDDYVKETIFGSKPRYKRLLSIAVPSIFPWTQDCKCEIMRSRKERPMPYSNSSGKHCVVIGCTNNQRKLYQWNNSECAEHGIIHKDCPCLLPYKLHCLPKNADWRRDWLKAINRTDVNPLTNSVVCSFHFKDGKPTKQNPVPALPILCSSASFTVLPKRVYLVKLSREMERKQTAHAAEGKVSTLITPYKTGAQSADVSEDVAMVEQATIVKQECCSEDESQTMSGGIDTAMVEQATIVKQECCSEDESQTTSGCIDTSMVEQATIVKQECCSEDESQTTSGCIDTAMIERVTMVKQECCSEDESQTTSGGIDAAMVEQATIVKQECCSEDESQTMSGGIDTAMIERVTMVKQECCSEDESQTTSGCIDTAMVEQATIVKQECCSEDECQTTSGCIDTAMVERVTMVKQECCSEDESQTTSGCIDTAMIERVTIVKQECCSEDESQTVSVYIDMAIVGQETIDTREPTLNVETMMTSNQPKRPMIFDEICTPVKRSSKKKGKRKTFITGYMLWSIENRPKLVMENPGKDSLTISKMQGELWSNVSDEQKLVWKQLAKDATENGSTLITSAKTGAQKAAASPAIAMAKQAMATGKKRPLVVDEIGTPVKGSNKKKKTRRSGYLLWCKENRPKVVMDNPRIDFSKISKTLGKLWSNLPEEKKLVWKQMAKDNAGESSTLITSDKTGAQKAAVSEDIEMVEQARLLHGK